MGSARRLMTSKALVKAPGVPPVARLGRQAFMTSVASGQSYPLVDNYLVTLSLLELKDWRFDRRAKSLGVEKSGLAHDFRADRF